MSEGEYDNIISDEEIEDEEVYYHLISRIICQNLSKNKVTWLNNLENLKNKLLKIKLFILNYRDKDLTQLIMKFTDKNLLNIILKVVIKIYKYIYIEIY